MSESRKKTVAVYTLGCKVNQYESEAILEEVPEELKIHRVPHGMPPHGKPPVGARRLGEE